MPAQNIWVKPGNWGYLFYGGCCGIHSCSYIIALLVALGKGDSVTLEVG